MRWPLLTCEVRKLARKLISQGMKEGIIYLFFFFFFSLRPLIFSFILFFSLIATDRGSRLCTSKISSSTKRDSDSSCYLRFAFWFMRSPSYQVESEIKVLDFGGFHLKGIKGMHQETGLVNYSVETFRIKETCWSKFAPQIARSLKLEIPADKEAK